MENQNQEIKIRKYEDGRTVKIINIYSEHKPTKEERQAFIDKLGRYMLSLRS